MRKIFTAVFAIHMIALLYFVISADMKKEKKRLHIKTMSAVPQIQTKTRPIAPTLQKKPMPQETLPVSAPQKPPVVKQTVKKEAKAPVKNPVPQKKNQKPPVKNQKVSSAVSTLLHQLEETIDKIDQKQDKSSPSKKTGAPKWIKPLKIDAIKEISDDDVQLDFTYQDSLIRCLREALDLPEVGEVKIELTLNKDGTVLSLRVLSAQNEKNRSYLEKNLQFIKFPPLGMNESRKTFVLTFCNEL